MRGYATIEIIFHLKKKQTEKEKRANLKANTGTLL